MSPPELEAVVLDMDGVITDTARLHARAWKAAFDAFLREEAMLRSASFVPFDAELDYKCYVDGKSRLEGALSFLTSRMQGAEIRGVEAAAISVCETKDALFGQMLDSEGVTRFEGTVDLITALVRSGVRVGVATSSRNAERVLRAANLHGAFGAVVDGVVAARGLLRSKPAPDIFLECCSRLGSTPICATVIEDASVGVEAARAGQFGLVVGVHRGAEPESLSAHGADMVVTDLLGVSVEMLRRAHSSTLLSR